MAKPCPMEFRDDVVVVARKGEASHKHIARDFGISDATLFNWLKAADGALLGASVAQASAEVNELRRRVRLLEQENEGLGFSKQAYYKWLKGPVTDQDWGEARLADAAMDIHADDPAFGYRFIADEPLRLGAAGREGLLGPRVLQRLRQAQVPPPQARPAGA